MKRKIIATLLTISAVATSAIPAMADLRVTSYSGTTMVGSTVGTAVINGSTNVYAEGKNVDIADLHEVGVYGSAVGTLVNTGERNIAAKGGKVKVSYGDTATVYGSGVGTYVSDRINNVFGYSR